MGEAAYAVDYEVSPNTEVKLAPIGRGSFLDGLVMNEMRALAVEIAPLISAGKPYILRILSVHSKPFVESEVCGNYGVVRGRLMDDDDFSRLKSVITELQGRLGPSSTRIY